MYAYDSIRSTYTQFWEKFLEKLHYIQYKGS